MQHQRCPYQNRQLGHKHERKEGTGNIRTREPQEDTASGKSALDLVYPDIVGYHGHPNRFLTSDLAAGIRPTPVPVLCHLERVPAPSTPSSEAPHTDCSRQDAALRWDLPVTRIAPPEDEGAEAEDDGGEKECEPESNVSLRIRHSDLSDQSCEKSEIQHTLPSTARRSSGKLALPCELTSDVDEKIEVVVDSGSCQCRIDNDTLTIWLDADDEALGGKLFSNEWRDVGLESSA